METLSFERLQEMFGLNFLGLWEETPLIIVEQACSDFCQAFQLTTPIGLRWMRTTRVVLEQTIYGGITDYKKLIKLNPIGLTRWTVLHELAHAWDYSSLCTLSLRMMLSTHSRGPLPILHQIYPLDKRYWYRVGSPPPPCGVNERFNRYEDFAEAVTAFVYPDIAFQRAAANGNAYDLYGFSHFYETPRGRFIGSLIRGKE